MNQGQHYVQQDRGERLNPGRSHPRYRHLVDLRDRLQEIIAALPAGKDLLDFGCGSQPYKPLFDKKFDHYLGADLQGNALASVQVTPQGKLLYDSDAVDCVLSSQVLEHVADPAAYLAEAYRVLKPDGHLILSTHGNWKYHPDPNDYWRWTVDGLQLQIERAGFKVVRVKSIFTLASCALQYWQDATLRRIPRRLRRYYRWFIQAVIGRIERRHAGLLSRDACVYIVLASKPRHAAQTGDDLDQEPNA